jgi:omega-amidase
LIQILKKEGEQLKISLAQIDIFWEDKAKNRAKALHFIQKASEEGSKYIIFPEMTLTGFSMAVQSIGESTDCAGGTVDWFKQQALQYNIHIGFGYAALEQGCTKGRNNFCTVSPYGEEIGMYSKIHPFSYGLESLHYTGGDVVTTFTIGEFTVSNFICYDLRFPEIFQIASRKAGLITVAANWPKARREHWLTLLKARAIENQCYIAGINRVGVGDNIEYLGDSLLMDPLGNVIAFGGSAETLITADIDIRSVFELRNSFRLKDDRREDLYNKL